MIVKMKKASVLCLQSEKEKTLESLREQGVVHLTAVRKTDSPERSKVEAGIARIDKAAIVLNEFRKSVSPSEKGNQKLDGAKVCERALDLNDHLIMLSAKLENFQKDEKLLAPWGDYSPSMLSDLNARGLHVYFCTGGKDKAEGKIEGAVIHVLKKEKGRYFFAVISEKPLNEEKIAAEPIFKKNLSLSKLRSDIDVTAREIEETKEALKHLVPLLGKLQIFRNEELEKLELLSNRDSMSAAGQIAYIQGYVPVTCAEKLKKTAAERGWSLLLEEPAKDDMNVPTLIEMPKLFKMAKPILDFVGVLPGYKEWDISGCLLIFFTIFFAMIVNDGGYGFLFLVVAIIAKLKIKDENLRVPINLFILLSLGAIAWGFLTANFFGIPAKYLPSCMHGVEAFTDHAQRDKNVQHLCFLLAAIHLSFARLWQAVLHFPGKKFLGEIGWAMLIWGNFFTAVELIVAKGSFPSWGIWLYVVGVSLIMIFYVHWNDFGDLCMTPLHLISSFVDVLSYIRLFALGVAGFYVAESFNEMGLLLYHSTPEHFAWVGLIGAIFIFVAGHLLNIALAFLGVMVHDIRLNALEFSNQMGLQWTGIKFNPFKKIIETKDLNKQKEEKI